MMDKADPKQPLEDVLQDLELEIVRILIRWIDEYAKRPPQKI